MAPNPLSHEQTHTMLDGLAARIAANTRAAVRSDGRTLAGVAAAAFPRAGADARERRLRRVTSSAYARQGQRSRMPTVDTLAAVAAALELDVSELLAPREGLAAIDDDQRRRIVILLTRACSSHTRGASAHRIGVEIHSDQLSASALAQIESVLAELVDDGFAVVVPREEPGVFVHLVAGSLTCP